MLGDIHGNYADLKYQINTKKISNCYIIQVGDFGIGTLPRYRDEENLKDLNYFLEAHGITMYVIRGNHDDPFYFKGQHRYKNLKLIPDYTILNLDGYKILLVGGALSVDRTISLAKMEVAKKVGTNQKLYWEDEKFVLDEEKMKTVRDIDIVVTHTAPTWCFPYVTEKANDFVMNFTENDPTLLDELKVERNKMDNLFQILEDNGNKIQKHFYGHFHRNEVEQHRHITHILLGKNELKELDQNKDYEEIFKIWN